MLIGGEALENLEVAQVLSQMADLLEIQNANPFRVRAYRNAARFVDSRAVPMRRLVGEESDLTELSGIGKDMASHIRDLVTVGRLTALDELTAKISRTLIDVMDRPQESQEVVAGARGGVRRGSRRGGQGGKGRGAIQCQR